MNKRMLPAVGVAIVAIAGTMTAVTQADATQGGHDSITFCHSGSGKHYSKITTDKSAFVQAGHIDHGFDIFPAGVVYTKKGEVSWPAQGDQSLLQYDDCTPPTTEPTPSEEPTPTDTPTPTDEPTPTDTPTPTDEPTPTDTPTTPTDTPTVPTETPTTTPPVTDTPAPTDTPTPPSLIPPTSTSVPKTHHGPVVHTQFRQHKHHLTKIETHSDGTVTKTNVPEEQVVEEGF